MTYFTKNTRTYTKLTKDSFISNYSYKCTYAKEQNSTGIVLRCVFSRQNIGICRPIARLERPKYPVFVYITDVCR